jgi:hypothetical protein
MADYTSKECVDELNEEYKKQFGYYILDKPSTLNSTEDLKKEFRFWWNLKNILNERISLESEDIISNNNKKTSVNMRKTMTKFHIIDTLVNGLRLSAKLSFDEYFELLS